MPEAYRAADQMQIPDLPQPVPTTTEPDDATGNDSLGVGAEKSFRPYDPNQILLLSPNLAEWLPAGHLARLISELVDNVLDLSWIYASYRELRGAPPYEPRLLLKLLLYGYASGIFSSRRLERAAQELVPCRYLTADQQPDHKTISEFRRRHLKALNELFGQVLQVCQKAGLVKLGHVALDGTKIKANASRHKAMSYGRMKEREAEYEKVVQGWLEQAEAIDQAEDEEFGKDRRGDELPEELQRAESRLRKLREAKAELEKEAQEQGREAPADKEQRNFSDPESRIMVSGEKAFVQAYNCQLAVDDTPHHIVLAAEVGNQASDNPQLLPMLITTALNAGEVPDKISADAGYSRETNLILLDKLGIDAYIAVDKDQHNRQEASPRGRIPKSAGPRERMRRKTRTKKGRAVYKRRKHVAEPPFGFIKQGLGFRQFLLRGLEKVSGEWKLVTLAYNLRRLHDSGRWRSASATA
ncbi:MAG TPA: IS1182 family transposase [Chloroflexota bacterium]|nr:IS1182 family transposase [Chloroflexota bacterium]